MLGVVVASVPLRNPLLVLATTFASFAGGPFLGVLVGRWVAPGSELAQLVSPLAFALAFVGGLLLWFGLGVVTVVADSLRRLLRGRWRDPARSPAGTQFVPPGHGAFLPLASGLGLVAGVVVGLAPGSSSFWYSCAVHVVAGAVYGASLRAAARHGYLPFPEPS